MTSTPSPTTRRQLLQATGLAVAALGAPALVRAQAATKIRVGYWPIAAGLPFYSAVELGFFKAAGIDVSVGLDAFLAKAKDDELSAKNEWARSLLFPAG